MHKNIFSISVVFVIFLGSCLTLGYFENILTYSTKLAIKSVIYPDMEDSKLKFVTSDNVVSISNSLEKIDPIIPVYDVYDKDDYTIIKTEENMLISSITSASVCVDGGVVTLKRDSFKVVIYNLEVIGVKDGQHVRKGDIIGYLPGNELMIKVYMGGYRVSSSRIRDFL